MAKFRKKPVVINAWRVNKLIDCAKSEWKKLPETIIEGYENGKFIFLPGAIEIFTLEGRMMADKDDWLIKGVKGEFYPCKPDIFEATYDEVQGS
jgi:hypothetical protein